MKNLLALFIISAISFSTFGQTEMKLVGSKIYVEDLRITLADAQAMALMHSPAAYLKFKKGKKRPPALNAVGVAGGGFYVAIGMGLVSAAPDDPLAAAIGAVFLVIGVSGLVAATASQVLRREAIISAVESYNKAIAE